jgi:hypothetical protein
MKLEAKQVMQVENANQPFSPKPKMPSLSTSLSRTADTAMTFTDHNADLFNYGAERQECAGR